MADDTEPMSPREKALRFVAHEKARETIDGAYRRLFTSPDGAAVLADLLKFTGLLSSNIDPNEPPHMAHVYNGQRSVGLHVVAALRWTERSLLQLAQAQSVDQLARQMEGE